MKDSRQYTGSSDGQCVATRRSDDDVRPACQNEIPPQTVEAADDLARVKGRCLQRAVGEFQASERNLNHALNSEQGSRGRRADADVAVLVLEDVRVAERVSFGAGD